MAIPIQNIYYLLCYAWNRLDEGGIINVSGIESNELADLFAKVLIGGTNHVLKDGLDRNYQEYSEDTSCLRGRIDFGVSIKRFLFKQAQAHCHFDELSHNTLHNRILKTTLRNLSKIQGLDDELRSKLSGLYRRFEDIDEIQINRKVFRQVQLHKNIVFYGFLMNICELINGSLLVDESTGDYRFRDFLRDEVKMRKVFEDFVRNFYFLEQSEFNVKADYISWDAWSEDESMLRYLPIMKTDISLRSPEKTIIIDTKYYKDTLQSSEYKETIHSGNLYQIFSYLKNIEKKGESDMSAEGILLYPTVSESIDLKYTIQGHNIRVHTINLSQSWKGIREDLLGLL